MFIFFIQQYYILFFWMKINSHPTAIQYKYITLSSRGLIKDLFFKKNYVNYVAPEHILPKLCETFQHHFSVLMFSWFGTSRYFTGIT